jgi:glycosyltransferase involved in cell wall biosynthesis
MSTDTDTTNPVRIDADGDPPELRLLILCAGDPDSERAFSGSARSLFQALERRGCVHYKANVLGYTDTFRHPPLPVRAFRKVDKLHLLGKYRYSGLAFHRNSRRAQRVADAHPGFNACLMYGTTYNPRLPAPTYCYFDATTVQVLNAAAWEHKDFSSAQRRHAVAYQQGVFDQCTGIFPRTEWAAGSVREDYGLPESKICIAGAGPNHYAEPLPHAPYDRKRILFIGKEFDRKGGPLILDAFRLVRKTIPDARLAIVGCDPGIREDGVEIVGVINKKHPDGVQRLLTQYSEASVFCVMSTFEPFGIVIVEAQNSFVPCVVPARFAFTETVVDNVTGRHVAEDDPRILADTLTELLLDPARLESMGRAGHAHVRENFTWDVAAERIHTRIQQDLARLAKGS